MSKKEPKEKKLERIRNGMVRALVLACEKGDAPAHIQAHYDNMWDDIKKEVLKQMESIVLLEDQKDEPEV